MAAGLAAFVGLVAVGWLAVTTLGLVIERHNPNADHQDLPSLLLGMACRRLPEDRDEWGRALRSELASITSRRARWDFMLGGIWTTIRVCRGGRLDRPAAVVFVGATGVCAGLVIAAIAAYPSLLMDPKTPTFLVVLTVALVGYAVAGLTESRRSAATSRRAIPGRWALISGVVLGLVWIVFASGWLDLHSWPLILAAVLPALWGAGSAHTAGGRREGIASVQRVALVAGLSAFVGSVLEAFATAHGPYDAGQLSESAGRGYASPATYWMGEGLATSLLLLLLIPMCTVVFGTAGAMIGQIGRPGSGSQSAPHAPVQ